MGCLKCSFDDVINLNVIPNAIVGVGSTAPLSLSFNSEFQKLLVNRTGFGSDANARALVLSTITKHPKSTRALNSRGI